MRGHRAGEPDQVLRAQPRRPSRGVGRARRPGQLPDRVQWVLDRRANAVQARRTAYRHWVDAMQEQAAERERWIDQQLSRSRDQGLDYGLEL